MAAAASVRKPEGLRQPRAAAPRGSSPALLLSAGSPAQPAPGLSRSTAARSGAALASSWPHTPGDAAAASARALIRRRGNARVQQQEKERASTALEQPHAPLLAPLRPRLQLWLRPPEGARAGLESPQHPPTPSPVSLPSLNGLPGVVVSPPLGVSLQAFGQLQDHPTADSGKHPGAAGGQVMQTGTIAPLVSKTNYAL